MEFEENISKLLDQVLFGKCNQKSDGLQNLAVSDIKDEKKAKNRYENVLNCTESLLQIFQDKYDSSFNTLVDSIFEQIQNLLNFYVRSNFFLHHPLNKVLNVTNLIVEIIISNPTEENISKLSDFYNANMSEIELKISKEYDNLSPFSEELSLRISLISYIYDAVHNVEKQHQPTPDLIIKLKANIQKNSNREYKSFFLLITNNCTVLAAQTLLNLIPKYVTFAQNNEILQYIWEELLNSLSLKHNGIEHSKVILILCCLSDLYFIDEQNNLIENIFKNKNYWILLQKGLINVAYSVRKQALFLLKISTHSIITNHLVLQNQDLTKIYLCKVPSALEEKHSRFEFNMEFQKIFTILEYIEEKQIHLVKQIFRDVQDFLMYYLEEGLLHISWIIIIFQRVLVHDNIEVVKWGILVLLKIPIEEFYDEEIITDIIHLLISRLNCTQLYFNDFELLLEELKNYFKTCLESDNGHLFFKLLIKEIGCIRWSSEALFLIINALSFVDKKNFWGKNEINIIKKLITSGITNHYTYIKSGMLHQLLCLSTNLIDTEEVSLREIFSFLSYFCRVGCLKRKAEVWNKVTHWINNSFVQDDVKNVIIELINNAPSNVKGTNIGKIIVLLSDAYGESFSLELINLIKTFLSSFFDIHARPYCNAQIQNSYLIIVQDIMSEELNKSELVNAIKPFLPNIVTYIELQLNSMYHVRDIDLCYFYIKILCIILSSNEVLTPELTSVMYHWLENIYISLEPYDSICSFPIQCFIRVKIVNLILNCDLGKDLSSIIKYLRRYLERNLSSPLIRTSHETNLTSDLQSLWGKMNSEFLEEKWLLFSKINNLGSSKEFLSLNNSEFLQLCFKMIDMVDRPVLLSLIDILDRNFNRLTNEPNFKLVLRHLWLTIIRKGKSSDYHQLMQSFINIAFQLDLNNLYLLDENQVSCCKMLYSINEANLLIKKIQSVKYEVKMKNIFSDILSNALLYGEILEKNEKLINYISSFIEKMNLTSLKNYRSTSNEVRGRAIEVMLNFNPENECHCEFISHLTDNLMKMEKKFKKDHYFADSHAHRINQRLMQSLLIIEQYLTEQKSKKLFCWLMKKIIAENHQPSVRYLQEWLILRILYKNPCITDMVWSYFNKRVDKRIGSLCSLISIVFHTVKFISMECKASWIEKAVRTFLPYCMAQHFSVRLYAQVALQKLMAVAENLNLMIIKKNYRIIAESLVESIENGKTQKNFIKLYENFYFNVFDPLEHYSLETIFFDIPRLTNVCSDEWISDSLFLNCGIKASDMVIPLRSENKALKSVSSSTWIVGGINQNIDAENIEQFSFDIKLENLQKKMIPPNYLVPIPYQGFCDDRKKMEVKDGLIVVASLIDRIPNLGGLTRTCEIFGVSKLVIGSLHYIEDKQFQSLSVTAEKWITISEVKPYNLNEFLIKMKQNGYTILAAEQTLCSKLLNKVSFPKKSLILLGNEKEGIPPNLLPLMDYCIEIPQMGNIRSLNVHVTGALLIWEYAKQHHFPLEETL